MTGIVGAVGIARNQRQITGDVATCCELLCGMRRREEEDETCAGKGGDVDKFSAAIRREHTGTGVYPRHQTH